MFINVMFQLPNSTADTCKNFAKRGNGLEFGTNKAFILYIKN